MAITQNLVASYSQGKYGRKLCMRSARKARRPDRNRAARFYRTRKPAPDKEALMDAHRPFPGERFGKLNAVLSRRSNNKWSHASWFVACDCGNTTQLQRLIT